MIKYAILVLMLFLVACSSNVQQQTIQEVSQVIIIEEPVTPQVNTTNTTNKTQVTIPKVEEDTEVRILVKFLIFKPNVTTIKKGTTVTWLHQDDIKPFHKVQSIKYVQSPTETRQVPLFLSENLRFGNTFSYTFNEVGTYRYLDPFFNDDDDYMGGVITVTE